QGRVQSPRGRGVRQPLFHCHHVVERLVRFHLPTTPRTAEMRPAGSPATRMTKLSAPPASLSSGLYTSGITSFANPVCRTSLTTPTTVGQGAWAPDTTKRIRLPSALWPGKKFFSNASLTITTPAEGCASCEVNARPLLN